MDNHKKNTPSIFTLVIRIVIALYLFYIVWSLRGAPAAYTGGERIFFIVAMIVFLLAGIVLGGISLKALISGQYEKPEDQEEEKQEDK